MAKYAKYGIQSAYLGLSNIVKWGIPEKIWQNTVLENITPALLVTIMRHDKEECDDDAREPWQSVRVSHLGPGACEPSRQHT